jgi:hypothetical protein
MSLTSISQRALGRGRAMLVLGAAVCGLLFGAAAPHSAAAAEISKQRQSNPNVTAIRITGEIETGDVERVKALVVNLPGRARILVYLDSTGGDLEEGIKLGEYFYQHRIGTIIGSGASCTYACSVAFLGGRDANGKAYRMKYASATLQFNVFGYVFVEGETYTHKQPAELQILVQHHAGLVSRYLVRIKIGDDVMFVMLEGAPVVSSQADALGIAVIDEETPVSGGARNNPGLS